MHRQHHHGTQQNEQGIGAVNQGFHGTVDIFHLDTHSACLDKAPNRITAEALRTKKMRRNACSASNAGTDTLKGLPAIRIDPE
jgi:hypothetical protein